MKQLKCFTYIVLLLVFAVSATAETTVLLDGLMAKVNEHSITIGDVMMQVQPLQRQLIKKYKGEELRKQTRKLFNKALDNLIESKLILDDYKEQKGAIPEWVIDKRVNEILHEVFNDDRTAMMRALADDNLTYEHWKNNIRDQMIVTSMRQANVQERIKVSAVDIRKYYDLHISDYKTSDTVQLQMIVLNKKGTDSEKDVKQKALDLNTQLKNGGDFSAAANKFSDGHKAADGGEWGWLEPTDLRRKLQDAESQLKVGAISDVIETDESLYILKVLARKTGSTKTFAEARRDIEDVLRSKEGRRIHDEWIAALKRNAKVEIMDIDPFAGN